MLRQGCVKVGLAVILIKLLFFMGTTAAREAQGNNLSQAEVLTDKLAKQLSGAGIKNVVVLDLTGPDGQSLPFGSWLADHISKSLETATGNINIIDRARLAEEMQNKRLAPTDAVAAEAAARSLNADSFVVGSFGPFKDQIGVTLVAYRTSNTKLDSKSPYLFMLNGKMPLDANAKAHLTFVFESLQPKDGVYKAGYAGRTVAECESCTPPQFPAVALWRVKQGTIVSMIVVSPDGRVSDVNVVSSPDSELNREAIRAIRNYKYKPALDPDGEPTAVRMSYVINFDVK